MRLYAKASRLDETSSAELTSNTSSNIHMSSTQSPPTTGSNNTALSGHAIPNSIPNANTNNTAVTNSNNINSNSNTNVVLSSNTATPGGGGELYSTGQHPYSQMNLHAAASRSDTTDHASSRFIPPAGATAGICRAVREDAELQQFERHTGQLHGLDLSDLSPFALTATCANLYNALLLHLMARRGSPPASRSEWKEIANGAWYLISGMRFTLQDIETGILRGNRRIRLRRVFGAKDPRRQLVVPRADPRVLFALAPQHASLPSLTALTLDDMDKQLSLHVQRVINDDRVAWFNPAANSWHLPAVFKR